MVSKALVLVLFLSAAAMAADAPVQGLSTSGGGVAVMKCEQTSGGQTFETVVYVSMQDVSKFYQSPVPADVQTTGVMTVTPSDPSKDVASVYDIAMTVTTDSTAQTIAYDVVQYQSNGQKLQELTTTFFMFKPNLNIVGEEKLFDANGNVTQQSAPTCDTTPLNGALL